MFKKILCLALAVMMLMSVAVIASSAAQIEVVENAADVPAEVGADAPVDTGASNLLYFDANSAGWSGSFKVQFYVYQVGGDELLPWGSKKLVGTDEGNGIWSYDPAAKGMDLADGVQYAIIFVNNTTSAQTYNLLFDTSCLGDTAYADPNTMYENPTDSTKSAMAAYWKSSTNFGPELCISSIGTVQGTTCPSTTTPYDMFKNFLTNTLNNARTFSGKDDQTLLDDTAKALGLGQDLIKKAIEETGVSVEWKETASSAGTTSDSSATQSGSGSGSSSSGSGSSSSGSGSSSSGSGSSSSGSGSSSSSSSSSGSGSTSKTGQETTVLFIMLGVMVAAAGVIFFVRKRERA
jgi:LPXTG-motif cell wall-anchored protein